MSTGRLQWKIERGAHTRVAMRGEFTEESNFAALLGELTGGPLSLDLAEVKRINSTGVREWMRFLKGLRDKGSSLVLERCSSAVVHQLSMVVGFRGSGMVKSVLASFVCPECGAEKGVLVDLAARQPLPESAPCPSCGSSMELDELPEMYESLAREVSVEPATSQPVGEALHPNGNTLSELLAWRAAHEGATPAYTFLEGDAEGPTRTWAEIDARARRIAAHLRAEGLEHRPVLLLFAPGMDFVEAFYGCLYAGAIAVPVYPPDPSRLDRDLPRVLSIVTDAQIAAVASTGPLLQILEALPMMGWELPPALRQAKRVNTESLPEGAFRDETVGPDRIAFLQYTSGSTGNPRGVQVTHRNLMTNQRAIQEAYHLRAGDVFAYWLPLYHDMGLIGHMLEGVYVGARCVFMSPLDFLRKPVRWLQAITKYKGAACAAPSFAYAMCARRVTDEEKKSLDLSSWRSAMNGSEVVRHAVMEQFAEAFASCGFKKEAFYPCYGLAEATLCVSGVRTEPVFRTLEVDAAALEKNDVKRVAGGGRVLVSCGMPARFQEVVIADPNTRDRLGEDRVGEIWVRGPSVSAGYWNRPDENAKTFGAQLSDGRTGPFLRTGDLGFLHDGELYVTGRLRELIVIRGRNHYPQDIEWTAEQSHPSIRRGRVAAFSVDVDGEEKLVLAVEAERRHIPDRRAGSTPPPEIAEKRKAERRKLDVEPVAGKGAVPGDRPAEESSVELAPAPLEPTSVVDAVREAVSRKHDLSVYDVVVLEAGTLPVTSSGKIRRATCRAAWRKGELRFLDPEK